MEMNNELVGNCSSYAEPPSFVDPIHRDVLGALTVAVQSVRNHHEVMESAGFSHMEWEDSVQYDLELALLTFLGIISPNNESQQKSILDHYSLGDLWIEPLF